MCKQWNDRLIEYSIPLNMRGAELLTVKFNERGPIVIRDSAVEVSQINALNQRWNTLWNSLLDQCNLYEAASIGINESLNSEIYGSVVCATQSSQSTEEIL